ncbi:hypothetical protein QJQ58_20180 [Paenibacillus dendritiformis]|uniref:hypothetical protein n=1 Tax=Paenibacillus dendritiformis TaxID=130049 RepID=UPI00248D1DF3|nr:hypothetical protein [Paenibacillus dendritiformis]WGU92868.1 hypothetical protein QJQ58_20180 [Paenibacillus dendritiformis]
MPKTPATARVSNYEIDLKCRISPVLWQPELQRDEIDVFLQDCFSGILVAEKFLHFCSIDGAERSRGRAPSRRLGKNAAELPTEPSKMMADWLAL